MLKSTPPNTPPNGNIKKYLSYREAWTRIKQAQQQGFYLEAVTLTESIISDRLISYLVYVQKIKVQPEKYLSFSRLIELWKNDTSSNTDDAECRELQQAVDNWRCNRNEIVHGMVKSYPGAEVDDVNNFLEKAKEAAKEGEKLARSVSSWCSKAKKNISKN